MISRGLNEIEDTRRAHGHIKQHGSASNALYSRMPRLRWMLDEIRLPFPSLQHPTVVGSCFRHISKSIDSGTFSDTSMVVETHAKKPVD